MSNIESVKLLSDDAKQNIKQFCDKENEDFTEVWSYVINKVDKYNLLEPLEFYKKLYNESLTWI